MILIRPIAEKHRRFFAFAILPLLLAAIFLGSGVVPFADLNVFRAEIFSPLSGNFEGLSPYALFFLLLAGTLLSEDLACIAGGVLAAQGKIGLAEAIAACGAGIFVGDIALFYAGRIFGRPALQWKITRRFLSENAVARSSRWLEREGLKTVFISRFVFGMRLPLYFSAGALATSFRRFALYFSLAVIVWTPLVVGLTYRLGAEAVRTSLFNQNLWPGLLLMTLAVYLLFRFVQQLFTRRGRRILWGRIKRRFIWEFWSWRVFYAPVVVYTAYLAIRHRSLTVFTCANPAIPAGGFAGESKVEILRGLDESAAAQPFLLKHLFLPKELSAGEKMKLSQAFMTANDLSFPIVLKPDVGERGAGVEIIETPEKLIEALSRDENLILQEYAAGEETSVFYYRRPPEETGKIYAITEKRFPEVAGDGKLSLEELILRDRRAVCLAEKYLQRNAERLDVIPAAGEKIKIIDIGTHSRGAIFLDGGWMKTAELERKIDEICRGYPGFYFGRFDIRVESFENFKMARDFKIVELNGVTSEATNIYDPRYSLLDAYRILFRQWRIAFEIGAENKRRGAESTKIADLTRLVFGRKIRNTKSRIQH